MPICCAAARAIGAIRTVVAVFESTCVNTDVSKNSALRMMIGLRFPKALVRPPAACSTRPTFSRAVLIGSIPAMSTMLFQSTLA